MRATVSLLGDTPPRGVPPTVGDPNRAFEPETGRNFDLHARCVWHDAATGQPVVARSAWPITPTSPSTYASNRDALSAVFG